MQDSAARTSLVVAKRTCYVCPVRGGVASQVERRRCCRACRRVRPHTLGAGGRSSGADSLSERCASLLCTTHGSPLPSAHMHVSFANSMREVRHEELSAPYPSALASR